MSTQEQEQTKEKYYSEAMRYMENEKEYLKDAKKEGNYYQDKKYVITACGVVYCGLLESLDGYLRLKDIKSKGKQRKSTVSERSRTTVSERSRTTVSERSRTTVSERSRTIEFYQENLAKIDKKMLNWLNYAYQILHLWGYYDGVKSVNVLKEGFDEAYKIIEKIKPANGTPVNS